MAYSVMVRGEALGLIIPRADDEYPAPLVFTTASLNQMLLSGRA